jgi:hypothetical protein
MFNVRLLPITSQNIRHEKVWATLPLIVGKDSVSRADQLYADVQWGSDAAKHLGTSTVVFIAKIGSSELASSGSFTLTP